MDKSQIILKPIITEKSLKGHPKGQFTFHVHMDATKETVAQAVKQLFGADALKVTMAIKKPTTRVTNRRRKITTSIAKKAVVFLEPGKSISIFEEPEKKKETKPKKAKSTTTTTNK